MPSIDWGDFFQTGTAGFREKIKDLLGTCVYAM